MVLTRVSPGLKGTMRKIGLGGLRLHDLRHTHASLTLAQGIHPKIVQERPGYSTVSIELDTYSHDAPGLQEAAALTIDGSLAHTVTVDTSKEVPLTIR